MNRPNATLLMALSALCLAAWSLPAAAQSRLTQLDQEPATVGQAGEEQPAQPGARDLEVAISSGASDAEEFIEGSADDMERWPAGYTYTGSSDLELAFDTTHGPQIVGLHFGSLGIPAGARVTSAVVRFTANADLDGPIELQISAQSDPAAGQFEEDEDAAPSHGISSRPVLAQQVAWSPEPVAAEQTFETPDLSPLLQQLVDHERWSEEGSLVLTIEAASPQSNNYRSAYSYDASSDSGPRLLVRYEPETAEPDAELAEPQPEAAEDEPETAEPGPDLIGPQPETAEPETMAEEPEQPAAADGREAADTAQGEPQRARYTLEPTHAAGVVGSVLISDYGLGGTVLSVSVDDPEPDVTYRASLHTGACASVQNELMMLQSIDGRRGLSATILDLPFEELTHGEYHVNVFRVGERTRLAACAQLASR